MDYVKLVETINAELEANGINTIYTLITNNVLNLQIKKRRVFRLI